MASTRNLQEFEDRPSGGSSIKTLSTPSRKAKMLPRCERIGLFLRPEAVRGPDIPYKNVRKENPRISGWFLVAAAFLMELLEIVRQRAWLNAGFGSLRKLVRQIEHTEPAFEPTVFPVEDDVVVDESGDGTDNPTGNKGVNPPPQSSHTRYSASEYRNLYLSGELTPLNVVEAILPIIRRDTSPPGQHSLAWFDIKVDAVLKAAEASTQRYQEGKSFGPLDGVPTAVKDEYDMEGYITTLGSANDYTGHELVDGKIDTWCVRKIEEAGAIIMGKLSMHEFGMDTSGNNVTFGTPRNPYNTEYYPGGSSGGSAYAVAVGLVPFTLGSDGGGSIRIPASFNSVIGLKTTHGRVSFYPNQNHSKTCGVNGPIATDIASLSAIYSVIAQPDPNSYFPLSPPLTINPHRTKVLGIPEAWLSRSTPAIETLTRNMVNYLATHKGYTVVPISIPFLVEGQIAHALTILTDAATLLPVTKGLTPANRILIALGRVTPSTDYLLAQKLRRVLVQHLAWLWEMHPGMQIITPTTSCAGWRIRSSSELKYGVSDADITLKTMEYVWMGNFCGVPSISVPAGFVVPEGQPGEGEIATLNTPGKVPVGLMATGEWASEIELMQFGLDAEEAGAALGLTTRPPGWVDVVELAKQKMRMSRNRKRSVS